MSLFGSLNTSSQGMTAQSQTLGQISDNVVNMNTTAYKQVETGFQTLMDGSEPSVPWTSLGVQPVDSRQVTVQGQIIQSSNSGDLAINGPGFFTVNTEPDGSGSTMYTRDGSFQMTALPSTVTPTTNATGVTITQAGYLTTQGNDYVMGWPANSAGGFTQTLSPIEVPMSGSIAATPTTAISIQGNVPSNNGVAASYSTSAGVITAGTTASPLGVSHNLPLTFTAASGGTNSWTVSVPSGGEVKSATITPSTLDFNGSGAVDTAKTPGTYKVAVTWSDGSTSTVTVDLTKMTQFATPANSASETATAGISLQNVTDNGSLGGSLTGTSFTSSGTLMANFSNQKSVAIAQIPLAQFVSPDQLTALSGNLFQASAGAGSVSYETAGSVTGGPSISPGALEQSNVNIDNQFSLMITTQTAYSMSSEVFKTSDEMVQTATGVLA